MAGLLQPTRAAEFVAQIPPPKIFFNFFHFSLTSPDLFCYTLVMLPLTIRKRTITEEDIVQIQATVDAHWRRGRKHISRVLCPPVAMAPAKRQIERHGLQGGFANPEPKRPHQPAAKAHQRK